MIRMELFCNKIEVTGKAILYSIIHSYTDRKQAEDTLRLLKKVWSRHFDPASKGFLELPSLQRQIYSTE